jgi:hypothetical protein
VQGRVTAIDNAALAGARVVVFASDDRYWQPGSTRRVRVMTVSPGGGFNIDGLPPGTYHAAAFPEGARITNTTLADAMKESVPFELAIGETKDVPVILRRVPGV